MGTSDELKRCAEQQIACVGFRFGRFFGILGRVRSLVTSGMKLFSEAVSKASGLVHAAENRRLKRELARVTDERDILEQGEPWFATGSRAVANADFARWSP
jgi:transposase